MQEILGNKSKGIGFTKKRRKKDDNLWDAKGFWKRWVSDVNNVNDKHTHSLSLSLSKQKYDSVLSFST